MPSVPSVAVRAFGGDNEGHSYREDVQFCTVAVASVAILSIKGFVHMNITIHITLS